MTKREKVLLQILGIVLVCVSYFLTFSYWRERIHNSHAQKERYVNASKSILERECKIENSIDEVLEYSTAEEASKYFFADLLKYQIIPEKYQILGNQNVEVTLQTTVECLISFLFGEKDEYLPYKMESINIKKVNGKIQAVIQIKPVFSKSELFLGKDSLFIKRLFEEYPQPKEKHTEVIQLQKKDEIINAISIFDYVGKATSESGKVLLILKNKDSGRVIKVQVENETKETYYFFLNKEKYELKKEVIL